MPTSPDLPYAGFHGTEPWWLGPTVYDVVEAHVVLTPGVFTQICASNPIRRALIIASPVAGAVTVGVVVLSSTSQGIPVSSSQPPLMLSYTDFGAIVTSQWGAISTAGVSITVIELILRIERLLNR